MLESFRIEREFQAAGWETLRMSGGTFKLIIGLPTGLRIGIDVFASFYFQGLLHMMPAVAADLRARSYFRRRWCRWRGVRFRHRPGRKSC